MDFTEIYKLKEMLDAEGIPNSLEPLYDGLQIKVYHDAEKLKNFDDAIIHSHSHGYAEGLLETYHLSNCDGYETAEQIFKGWKKMFKKIRKNP